MTAQAASRQHNVLDSSLQPTRRRLRGYAFDPSFAVQLDAVGINTIVYPVPWEEDLQPGPIGEYVEVIDVDPASGVFYPPVNLNDPVLLAQDGLPPSESNPQFHQQMVYAVAMTTIQNFQKALGRPVQWSPVDFQSPAIGNAAYMPEQYVQRLRLYPHAFRDANAYYSQKKKAVLFGYFPAQPSDVAMLMPGSLVFTCLSHDIIAHEVTHALIDGIYKRYVTPYHRDTLALHEAFSDLVALFQHFTFPELIENQIARTRGDLRSDNLLGQLAQQMGLAVGNYSSLRNAIGQKDIETQQWTFIKPDPGRYEKVEEAHERGSILVAAVFDAFLNIYRTRTADLIRIASGGTGVLPNGDIHPDLVKRLAAEAARIAQQFLIMCIRALDYCPPLSTTFGDLLRGIISADADLVPDDALGYRVAFVESFKRWGIYPADIRTLSVENLSYHAFTENEIRQASPVDDSHRAPGRQIERLRHWEASDEQRFMRRLKDMVRDLYYMPREWVMAQSANANKGPKALANDVQAARQAWQERMKPLYEALVEPFEGEEKEFFLLYETEETDKTIDDSVENISYLVRQYFNDTAVRLTNREALFNLALDYKVRLHKAIDRFGPGSQLRFQELTGLLLQKTPYATVCKQSVDRINRTLAAALQKRNIADRIDQLTIEAVWMGDKKPDRGRVSTEVHSLRRSMRIGPGTNVVNQVILTLMQCFYVKLKGYPEPYEFRGGCTMVMDIDQRTTRFVRKNIVRKDETEQYVLDYERLTAELIRFYCHELTETESPFAPQLIRAGQPPIEPFALLHHSH